MLLRTSRLLVRVIRIGRVQLLPVLLLSEEASLGAILGQCRVDGIIVALCSARWKVIHCKEEKGETEKK